MKNFFKKLFSSGKDDNTHKSEPGKINIQGVTSEAHFRERYTEDPIDPAMLDGCLKMVESYFLDNKITRKVATSVNDPANLDQVIEDGFGFALYCKAFNLGKSECALFLAYAFSHFLMEEYGFRLYKDLKPEYPLRGMTLKYDKDEVVLSLYPFEYAMKVLDQESTFQELMTRIETSIGKIPELREKLDDFLNQSGD